MGLMCLFISNHRNNDISYINEYENENENGNENGNENENATALEN